MLFRSRNSFNPQDLIIRRINSTAPEGVAADRFAAAFKAVACLTKHSMVREKNGDFTPDYSTLFVWSQCLPILLLRTNPRDTPQQRNKKVERACERFLKGNWESLYNDAKKELTRLNEKASQLSSKRPAEPPANDDVSDQQKGRTALELCRMRQFRRAAEIGRAHV